MKFVAGERTRLGCWFGLRPNNLSHSVVTKFQGAGTNVSTNLREGKFATAGGAFASTRGRVRCPDTNPRLVNATKYTDQIISFPMKPFSGAVERLDRVP
jgi:hypothetical protein